MLGWIQHRVTVQERGTWLASWTVDSFRLLTHTPAVRFNSGPGAHAHETESFEAFNTRYQTFFSSCGDLFELQRGLNNCFAYDLVPTTDVIEAALRCARKVNDYATAVRILEGVKVKVENKGQYQAYLDELSPVLKELGQCKIATNYASLDDCKADF